VAEQVGGLFRGLIEGSSKEEECHHHRLLPPPQTMPPLLPLPMTTLTAIGGKGFTSCSWVNLQPESALRHRRIIGSAGATTTKVMLAPTMARNNIEDGDSKSGRWTA
jgi:hypothetical protein